MNASLLLQVPPLPEPSLKVVVDPIQKAKLPVILPGRLFTVITAVVRQPVPKL
jgi:hypothetical protein